MRRFRYLSDATFNDCVCLVDSIDKFYDDNDDDDDAMILFFADE